MPDVLGDAFRPRVKANLLSFAARQGLGPGAGLGTGLGLGLGSDDGLGLGPGSELMTWVGSASAPVNVPSEDTLYDMGEATNRTETYNSETGRYVVTSGKAYGLLAGIARVGVRGSKNDASAYNYG